MPKPAKSAKADRREVSLDRQEERVLAEFMKTFGTVFHDPGLLKLALTHRSYLSVTGQGPRESNERLEFLGDSVLGLVTAEYFYRLHPDEHEGQLTKTKSLLVSKAILSRRALRMGLGRFVLMSHSEVESGGRQRLSILADAFESVLGAIYLDQGFEASRQFIHKHLLEDSDEIVADKRHTNYKSHLQEYVQSTYRTHPVYRIRSEYGPDHSKHFMVEVLVGRRTLGEGRGHNKKEAEQAAARNALENVKRMREGAPEERAAEAPPSRAEERGTTADGRRRRRRRGGRGRTGGAVEETGEPLRREAAPRGPARPVEEYEAGQDAHSDDTEFDVDVVSPGHEPGAVHAAHADDEDEDDEGVVDDLDETANDEIDDEADEDDEDDAAEDDEDAEDDLDDEDDPDDEDEEDEDDEDRGPAASRVEDAAALERAERERAEAARRAAEIEQARAEAARRTAEMEQAMEDFGQRKPDTYGRKGRPARRGR